MLFLLCGLSSGSVESVDIVNLPFPELLELTGGKKSGIFKAFYDNILNMNDVYVMCMFKNFWFSIWLPFTKNFF